MLKGFVVLSETFKKEKWLQGPSGMPRIATGASRVPGELYMLWQHRKPFKTEAEATKVAEEQLDRDPGATFYVAKLVSAVRMSRPPVKRTRLR